MDFVVEWRGVGAELGEGFGGGGGDGTVLGGVGGEFAAGDGEAGKGILRILEIGVGGGTFNLCGTVLRSGGL